MAEYFFLLCIMLRHTRRLGTAQRDLLLLQPRESQQCWTSCYASQPQGRLGNSSSCPAETPGFGEKCLFLQQSKTVSS